MLTLYVFLQLFALAGQGYGELDDLETLQKQAQEIDSLREFKVVAGRQIMGAKQATESAQEATRAANQENERIRQESDENISALNAQVAELQGRLARHEAEIERERAHAFRSFHLSAEGVDTADRYRAALIGRYNQSSAFLVASLGVIEDYLTNCIGVISGNLKEANIDFPLNARQLIDRCPDDTPSFQGYPNEDPNSAWWAGIWESVVQNQAAGEGGAAGNNAAVQGAPANPPAD